MPSVSRAAGTAYDHTVRILFKPFDLGKWFVMGFAAFLAHLGGGSGGFNFSSQHRSPLHSNPFPEALAWVQQHLVLVVILAVLILAAVAALSLLFAWLAARGDFMLLDDIVRNRGEVAEPWHGFREPANRLFAFRIWVGVCALGFLLVMVLIGAALVWPMLRQGAVGEIWKPLLLLSLPATLGLCLFGLYWLVLRDFGVPLMYCTDAGPQEAMGTFFREVLSGRVGTFILFYLLKLGLGIASVILILAAGCLTCCIGFLPYLNSVLTLPVTVFFKCYALDLLAQIREEWRLLPAAS